MSMELAINLDLLHRLDQLDHWRNQPAHSQGFHLDPLLPMPFPMAMGCFGIRHPSMGYNGLTGTGP